MSNLVILLTEQGYPLQLEALAALVDLPLHSDLICCFLFNQIYPNVLLFGDEVDLNICPIFNSNIHVFHSALATFYAPSDSSGIGGMHCEHILATPCWRKAQGRYGCVLLEKDHMLPRFRGLHVVQVHLFFSFKYNQKQYPCAMVQWFAPIGDCPCKDTGMWMVEPDLDHDGECVTTIVHLDSIVRGAHLIPIFSSAFIPHELHFSKTLDAFRAYYINKYADHHMHTIAYWIIKVVFCTQSIILPQKCEMTFWHHVTLFGWQCEVK